MSKLRIKTGDQVMVITGKDAGQKGKVIQVFPASHRVVVEGLNQMTKNVRARKQGEKGQRIQFTGPIDVSNVMLIDPKSGLPTRVGSVVINNRRQRRAIRSKEPIT